MFQASSAHLQEDTVVHMQHMCLKTPTNNLPPPISSHWGLYRQATKNSHREWQYHMLHVHNCILLKMSTWRL